jgi:hypothetical protein
MKITVVKYWDGGVAINKDGAIKPLNGRNLRMGFCFPETAYQGHFCVACQISSPSPKNPVCLVEEGTGETTTQLLTNLFNAMKKYRLFDYYCRVETERDKEFLQELAKFKKVNDVYASLRTNNYCNNFILGTDLLADHVNKEAVYMADDSVVYEQLKIMTTDDRGAYHNSFTGVQAFVCAVSSYGKERTVGKTERGRGQPKSPSHRGRSRFPWT